jgi:hypothetical protein
MSSVVKTCAIPILAALVFAAVYGEARAASPTRITDVRISDDLRRVVVKGNGPLSPVHKYRQEGPSRLAILLSDTVLGDVDRTIRNPDNSALLVYVSSTDAGVKLVLDFGKAGVPEFKTRVMDNCLIALLGPSGSPVAPPAQDSSFSSVAGTARPPKLETAKREPVETHSDSHVRHDLKVCSAEVIDGLIVLQVASKQNPAQKYKIKLGLNLDSLGFNSATLSRMEDQGRVPHRTKMPKPASVPPSNLGANAGEDSPTVSAKTMASRGVRTSSGGLTNVRVTAPAAPHERGSRDAEHSGPVVGAYHGVPQAAQWTARP